MTKNKNKNKKKKKKKEEIIRSRSQTPDRDISKKENRIQGDALSRAPSRHLDEDEADEKGEEDFQGKSS
uniref:Uncharacterized protein n=1 Tax=Vespula pensylvanica TaxID=30213 RepID=A0A834N7W7_VESPE|nr:hypothetical protein H0235_015847 [Vespula pensylvanica]